MRKSLGDKRKMITDRADRRDDPLRTRTRCAIAADPEHPRARQGEGLRHHRLRLPADHRRAPAAAALRGHRGDARRCWRRHKPLRSTSDRESLLAAFKSLLGTRGRRSGRPRTRSRLPRPAVGEAGRLPAVEKALWEAFSVATRTARCRQSRGSAAGRGSARLRERAARRGHPRLLRREVLPHVPDAWIDASKTKIGYEIPFTRHFYVYTPPGHWPKSTPSCRHWNPDSGPARRGHIMTIDVAPWLVDSRWPTVADPVRRSAGNRHTPSRQHPEYWKDCTIPWVTLADVGQLRDGTLDVISTTSEMISPLGVANSSAVRHPAGDRHALAHGVRRLLGDPGSRYGHQPGLRYLDVRRTSLNRAICCTRSGPWHPTFDAWQWARHTRRLLCPT